MRFLWRRIAGKLRPRRGPAFSVGEVMGEDPAMRPTYFHGVYRPRAIPGRLCVIRAADQPEWFRRFGEGAPDLGWAGFGRQGIDVSSIAGSRSDALRGHGLVQVAAAVRAQLAGR
jgi:hypothetical protein